MSVAKNADRGLDTPQIVDSKKAAKKPAKKVIVDDKWKRLAFRLAVELGWSKKDLEKVFDDR